MDEKISRSVKKSTRIMPMDALNSARGKTVIVKLRNAPETTGTLEAFDLHMNLWISSAVQEGEKIGHLVIRGEQVVQINPTLV